MLRQFLPLHRSRAPPTFLPVGVLSYEDEDEEDEKEDADEEEEEEVEEDEAEEEKDEEEGDAGKEEPDESSDIDVVVETRLSRRRSLSAIIADKRALKLPLLAGLRGRVRPLAEGTEASGAP